MRRSDEQWRSLISEAATEAEVERLLAEWTAETQSDEDYADSVDDFGGMSKLERDRLKTEEAQEIGPLPAIADRSRRESCRMDLARYAKTYFWPSVNKGFAPYQSEMVAAFQQVVLSGGKEARAVRRGGLKSTLARIAVSWAVMYGHRKFPVLVGATDDKSNEHRDNLLAMWMSSELHKADFPELGPLLLKKAQPKKQLRLDGELLLTSAKDERGVIVLPKIPGMECSEARIAPYSVLSTDVSGLSFVSGVGETVRPDLLIFDDVQTPQSAASFAMTSKREDAITTTFIGLAGLGETIAAIMVCTRRTEDDLTSRFCDRARHPDWDGKMFPVLIREPDSKAAKEQWVLYGQKLRDGTTPADGFALASAHYREHRSVMDEGGIVAWDADKEAGYDSALQWAMTVATLQPDYFRCELQQQGAKPPGDVTQLDAKILVKRLSNVPRGVVPSQVSYLTCHVDCQNESLWWAVCGWRKDFTGWLIDYGTFPEQHRAIYYKEALRVTISNTFTGVAWEEAFVAAHEKLEEILLGKDWPIEGGGNRAIDLLLKDWSDGHHKDLILSQVMLSKHRPRIRPAKGFAPKPGRKEVHNYGDPKRDRQTGRGWVERRTTLPIHVQFDANVFKSNVTRRLTTVAGAPSAMLLPGNDEQELILLSEHLTAERCHSQIYDGNPGVVWELLPGRDNEWFDNIVGCAVAASMLGCDVPGAGRPAKIVRERRSLAETMAR